MNQSKKRWTDKFEQVRSTKLISKVSLLIPMSDKKKEHWVDVKITRVNKLFGHFYSVDTLSGHYTGKKLHEVLLDALVGECESNIKITGNTEIVIKK